MTLGHTQAGNSTLPITVCLDRRMIFPGLWQPTHVWCARQGAELYRERAITGEAPTLLVPMQPSISPLMSQYNQPNSLKIQFHFYCSHLVNKDPLDTPLPHLAGIRAPPLTTPQVDCGQGPTLHPLLPSPTATTLRTFGGSGPAAPSSSPTARWQPGPRATSCLGWTTSYPE